ncbi:hypothetical protein GCM10011490_03980 [Pseudoclavibacter endophyticus]|nr:DUF4190 domain-containing protein [Pseudoclavibacter endophyticus]GGA57428.1 hypothetical protein GCM10011490_03980 [Pseudoclavibacter endophyticus]
MTTSGPHGQSIEGARHDPGAGGAQAPSHGAVPPAPGYAPVPYQPQSYAAPRPTNTMAIIALVGGILTGVVGIVCGHIALNQIKRTGEDGHGLALAGLIIGYVFTAVWVGIVLFYLLYVLVFIGIFGAVLVGSSV